MRVVIADTSPIFYLLITNQIEVLHLLFQRVILPEAVIQELCHPAAPTLVRDWARTPPEWADVKTVHSVVDDAALRALGAGERAAIALAVEMGADLLLIDERKGTSAALRKGFEVSGTLGILALAARLGFIDLAEAFARLKGTNFRYRQAIMDDLL